MLTSNTSFRIYGGVVHLSPKTQAYNCTKKLQSLDSQNMLTSAHQQKQPWINMPKKKKITLLRQTKLKF